jgi:hypothetical protein
MRRTTLRRLLILVALLSLLGAGIWRAANPPISVFVIDGANHIQYSHPQFGHQQLVYTTTNTAWRTVIGQRLREHNWQGKDLSNPYDYDNYYRIQHIWFIAMIEMVVVRGTSTRAEISIWRRIELFGIRLPWM